MIARTGSEPGTRWVLPRGDEGGNTASVTRASAVSGVAGTGPAERASIARMPAAPGEFRPRVPLDLEALCYLMKESSDASIQSSRGLTEAKLAERKQLADKELGKATEARVAAQDASFWGTFSKIFSWVGEIVGTTLAVAAAIATGGTLAIVIAAGAMLNSILEHSNAYKEMGTLGDVLSGAMKTLAAAGNWGSLTLTAVSQATEKLGGFAALAKECAWGAALLQGGLAVGSLASNLFWDKANTFTSPKILTDAQKWLGRAAKVINGAAQTTAGVGQLMQAVKKHDADLRGIEAKQFRLQADKLRKAIDELMDDTREETKRRDRMTGLAAEVQQGRHETAMTLARATVRG